MVVEGEREEIKAEADVLNLERRVRVVILRKSENNGTFLKVYSR
jgi:hypothetical protein